MPCALQVLLPADRIDSESQAEGKVGKVWGLFSDCITMKTAALKVCKTNSDAKALVLRKHECHVALLLSRIKRLWFDQLLSGKPI